MSEAVRFLPFVRALLVPAALALASCNTSDVLQPTATDVGAPVPDGTVTTAPAPPPSGAVVSAGTRLQFAPIVGTPVEAAGPLTERLAQRVRQAGITLARDSEPFTHTMKGYFSAFPDGGRTTVIYVWDVLDPAGNRLHRIQGQQAVSGAEGWPSVSAATMQAIADDTVNKLTGWLVANAG